MNSTIPGLAIIIVNYKTPQLVLDCIHSVTRFTSDIQYSITVVDNYSGDDSRSIITTEFPSVKWIQMDYNSGFARANNEGIRQAGTQNVLLLNSDTLLNEDAIGNCYHSFVHSDFIACGVQLQNTDLTPQISGNFFMTGGLNNLLPLPYTGKILKWIANIFHVAKPHVPDASATIEVDWINGAFLMVKRTAIEKAGLMDEDFFLYAEEAEWCYRLQKVGPLAIFGQYHLIHLQGETSNAAFSSESKGYYNLYDRKGFQLMLSNFLRIKKQFRNGWVVFHLLAYSFTVPLFFILNLFTALLRFKKLSVMLKPVTDFAGNVGRLWRYLPTILSGKPHFYKVL